MPDTPANQPAYPQSPSQKPGLGFPIARFVVLFCLATGAALEMAIGQYRGKQTGENALFRSLWDDLEPEHVVLGDRYYCSYFDIAMLKPRGVDSVFRLHQRRPCDFRRGRRWGREDQIVTWYRPPRPDWMDEETYDQIPETMEIRPVRIHVGQPGLRTRVLEPATTLLDHNFKGALQTVQEFAVGLREGTPLQQWWLWRILVSSIAGDAVGDRPDRVESRARKRRPKQYPLLTKPRRQAQAALRKAG